MKLFRNLSEKEELLEAKLKNIVNVVNEHATIIDELKLELSKLNKERKEITCPNTNRDVLIRVKNAGFLVGWFNSNIGTGWRVRNYPDKWIRQEETPFEVLEWQELPKE